MPATWYFDFISPFAYLQWHRLRSLNQETFTPYPILFASVLNHHGQLGPAEISAKRLFTYQHVQWRADRAGIPLAFPPAHPFDPLPTLRLCLAAGATHEAVDSLFDHIWGRGDSPESPEGIQRMADRIGIHDPEVACAAVDVKDRLRSNTERAIADGVFGVPTLHADGHIFWGEDATEMFLDYLDHPHLFETLAMRRLIDLPLGRTRPAAGRTR